MILFVQPKSDYQLKVNNHALALTFPHIISDLKLDEASYDIFIEGKSKGSFIDSCVENQISHVFITSNTNNFPSAVRIAEEAKGNNLVTIIGGLFATLNSGIIAKNFPCFDFIVTGRPDSSLIPWLTVNSENPQIIAFQTPTKINKKIASILLSEKFSIYRDNPVCYEITRGCNNNCNFCTMRKAWAHESILSKSNNLINDELNTLSNVWTGLKIIDDDFFQSIGSIEKVSIKNGFKEIIAQTRLD